MALSSVVAMAGTLLDGAPVSLTATRVDRSSYPLMKSRFRWVFD